MTIESRTDVNAHTMMAFKRKVAKLRFDESEYIRMDGWQKMYGLSAEIDGGSDLPTRMKRFPESMASGAESRPASAMALKADRL